MNGQQSTEVAGAVRDRAAVVQPSSAIVPLPSGTSTRRAWGADFAAKLLGTDDKPKPVPSTVMTYGRAAGFAVFTGVEMGLLGLLAGALHKRGLLAPGGVPLDGIGGLIALALSVPASVYHPIAGRAVETAGLAGIFSAAFRTGMGSSSSSTNPGASEPSSSPRSRDEEDPIVVAAREVDLL